MIKTFFKKYKIWIAVAVTLLTAALNFLTGHLRHVFNATTYYELEILKDEFLIPILMITIFLGISGVAFGVFWLLNKNFKKKWLKYTKNTFGWIYWVLLSIIFILSLIWFGYVVSFSKKYYADKILSNVNSPQWDKAAIEWLDYVDKYNLEKTWSYSSLFVDPVVLYTSRDKLEARYELVRELAEKDNARAQYLLVTIYLEKGDRYEEERDIYYERALYWTIKAADNDYPRAQYIAGLFYDGTIWDGLYEPQKALHYLTLAANNGIVKSYFPLGCLYENQGNKDKAIETWKKGAKMHDEQCRERLEKMEFLDASLILPNYNMAIEDAPAADTPLYQ